MRDDQILQKGRHAVLREARSSMVRQIEQALALTPGSIDGSNAASSTYDLAAQLDLLTAAEREAVADFVAALLQLRDKQKPPACGGRESKDPAFR